MPGINSNSESIIFVKLAAELKFHSTFAHFHHKKVNGLVNNIVKIAVKIITRCLYWNDRDPAFEKIKENGTLSYGKTVTH
jgi:hypothetical protein